MKTIKRLLGFFSLLFLWTSCSTDDSPESTFPRLYVYNGVDIGDCKEYIVGANNTFFEINQTSYSNVVKAEVLETFDTAPKDLVDIELQNEELVRLKFELSTSDFDTVANYQINGDFLEVDLFLEFSAFFLVYDAVGDRMLARWPVIPVFPGPDAIDPDASKYASIYYQPAKFKTFDEQVVDLLASGDYAIGDTIRMIETRNVYSRE